MYQNHLTRWLWSTKIRNESAKRRDELLRDAWEWYDRQVTDLKQCPAPPPPVKWDIWSSIYYSVTLYTTIGYGNIAPRSRAGRLASLIYALFGIPLLLYILDITGKAMTHAAEEEVRRFNASHPRLATRLHLHDDVPLTAILLLFIFWLCFCSALFLLWETEWDYFTSFYFVFISFSTIGLGDVVPNHPKFTLMCSIFVIFGLAVVSMLISTIQSKIERLFDSSLSSIEEEYRRSQTETSGRRMSSGQASKDVADVMQRLCKPRALEQKILFRWMSSDKKVRLQKEWNKKCQMVNRQTQTDRPRLEDFSTQIENMAFDLNCKQFDLLSELLRDLPTDLCHYDAMLSFVRR